MYESWRCLIQAFILKKGNYFFLDLHYAHKAETGQRHTQKRSKNLFYLQMKILQRFSKNTYMRRMIVDKVKNFSDFKLHYMKKPIFIFGEKVRHLPTESHIWVLTKSVPGFHIEKSRNFCFDIHHIHKVETEQSSAILKNEPKIRLAYK